MRERVTSAIESSSSCLFISAVDYIHNTLFYSNRINKWFMKKYTHRYASLNLLEWIPFKTWESRESIERQNSGNSCSKIWIKWYSAKWLCPHVVQIHHSKRSSLWQRLRRYAPMTSFSSWMKSLFFVLSFKYVAVNFHSENVKNRRTLLLWNEILVAKSIGCVLCSWKSLFLWRRNNILERVETSRSWVHCTQYTENLCFP